MQVRRHARAAVARLRRIPNYVRFRWRTRHADISETGLAMYRASDYSPACVDFFEAAAAHWFEHGTSILIACPLEPGEVVLDVGAFDGKWALEWRSRYDARVHLFEPDPEATGNLRELFAGDEKAELHTYGLAAANATVPMHIGGRSSSIAAVGPAARGGWDEVSVELRDVVEVFDQLGLDEVGLLKVNIEGAEYDLLDRLVAAGLHERCRHVRVQFHRWYPGARRRRRPIVRALDETHAREWSYPFVWESWVRREAEADPRATGSAGRAPAGPPAPGREAQEAGG